MTPAGQRSAGAASNQYQILGHLATGGMAELYLARAVGIAGFERYVVLKRIMAEHARNHRFVTMFLDEARLAAQLHHANIAQVYDIGRVSDSYFFTMEYVHGENVRDVLQRVAALKRQIPFEVSLTVIAGAAAGLNYAHEKRGINREPLGIVHRDVSPSNLMVAYEGAVKLVDFGIAKASHRMTETRSGAVKGKVAYMSPEQCTGHPLDRRSDIFSLGIVLYEMATMTRLFKHATDFETMTHIVNNPVPPPSSRRPDLPRELEHIILKALAKKPDDRFQTAGELLEAIEQFSARERLALSNHALARYIRELFGERPEPWYELEVGEQTGLITVETAAVPDVPEPDPFGPNSTQRSWSGAGKTAPREWGASSPSSPAFGENALPTSKMSPSEVARLTDGAATPTVRGKYDDLAARLEARKATASAPATSAGKASVKATPAAAPPAESKAARASAPVIAAPRASAPVIAAPAAPDSSPPMPVMPASVPTLIAPGGLPPGDAPRKPATNPAAAPPPPLRTTGQTAIPVPPGPTTGPVTTARSTLAGLAPPPATSHPTPGSMPTGSVPIPVVQTSSPGFAVPPVELDELAHGEGTLMHTQLSTPSSAPLVVQHPEVMRDTPDRDPSWAGEHDPSWRGGTHDAPPVRSSRRWVLWSALATAAAGAAILFAIGRGDGASTASVPAPKPAADVQTPTVEARGAAGDTEQPSEPVGAGSGSGERAIDVAPGGSGAGSAPTLEPGSVSGSGSGSGSDSGSGSGSGSASGSGSDSGSGSGSGSGSDSGSGSVTGSGSGSAATDVPVTRPRPTGNKKPPAPRTTKPPPPKPNPTTTNTGAKVKPKPTDPKVIPLKPIKKCGDPGGLYPPCE